MQLESIPFFLLFVYQRYIYTYIYFVFLLFCLFVCFVSEGNGDLSSLVLFPVISYFNHANPPNHNIKLVHIQNCSNPHYHFPSSSSSSSSSHSSFDSSSSSSSSFSSSYPFSSSFSSSCLGVVTVAPISAHQQFYLSYSSFSSIPSNQTQLHLYNQADSFPSSSSSSSSPSSPSSSSYSNVLSYFPIFGLSNSQLLIHYGISVSENRKNNK